MAKAHSLIHAHLRAALRYDKKTGAFTWKQRPLSHFATKATGRYWNRQHASTLAGSVRSDGYLAIKLDGERYTAGRLAWFYVTGKWPDNLIDHIDTDKLNNRWKNLRDATPLMNSQNQRRAMSTNKLGLLGVKQHPRYKTFSSAICVDGEHLWLGSFKEPERAHEAYVQAKRKHHAGCTL